MIWRLRFISLSLEITSLVGTALAGVAITFFPYKILFLADALSFFINVILVVIIIVNREEDGSESAEEKNQFFQSMASTFHYIRFDHPFRNSIFYYSLLFFLRGILFSQIVVFLINELSLGDNSYAYFQNLILIGVMIAQLIMTRHKIKGNEVKWLKVSLFIASFCLILLSVAGNIFIMVVFGISQAIILNMWYTYFYKSTPASMRGKLLSICGTFFEICRIIGIACVGFTINFISIRQSFMLFSILTIVLAVFLSILDVWYHRHLKKE